MLPALVAPRPWGNHNIGSPVLKTNMGTGIVPRLLALVPEREIFVRAGGTVRFVRITTRMQVMAAGIVAMLLGVWLVLMGLMLWRQASVEAQQAAILATRTAVSSEAARASADRRSVDSVARDLEKRQDALDALMQTHFGEDVDQSRVVGEAARAASGKPAADPKPRTLGMTGHSGAGRLAILRERQSDFAAALGVAAKARLARVEAAIRQVGLNPAQLARSGSGGPFIPAAGTVALATLGKDRQLRSLSTLLDRLSAMESALTVLPSGSPTASPMLTSSYGYRRDPFNGLAAFHSGIDFPGRYGQPILAASEGRVAFVGQRSGYGNCIEVDHGHGILTRYAHLAGFVARPGQAVERGQPIGRMGSTGRSTGTHLHFEVRINGAAVNPRPFLEARPHVLEAREDSLPSGRRPGNRG
ncbi:M23 family metallopeptidase [Sphingobium sufflavum]|uniref:M23 family metallopeptidase n=1 Tax=Sphingobium sufflavum TaxID=1129547 RepID=UPI001F361F6D|nr:M23 family metallopeptidase [Sphingobium sufflavum]MCE7795589.1 M23 family metallopeptidase [Sphingobium sufflavum]